MQSSTQPKYLRRNYVLSITEGGFFMGGMTFLSMESVMPTMIHDLGGPAWAISLAPVLFFLGFTWPQIFSALWVERLRVMKPMIMTIGVFQRLPYFLTGLFLIFAGREHPVTSVVLAFLTPFIASSLGGIQGAAYFELLTRMIPVNRIASMWAIRNVMMALFGILAGILIIIILDRYPGAHGYGILHLLTFSMMMISLSLFIALKEGNIPEGHHLRPITFRSGFEAFISNWRMNPSLGRLIITRILFMSIFVIIPFLSIRAIGQTNKESSLVGMLVLAQMIGFISGNVLAGYVGDRKGSRIPMLLSRVILLAILLWVPFATEAWQFMTIFCLLGIGLSTGQVSDLTIVFDFAPSVRRKFYFAVMALLFVPGILFASLCSAVLQYLPNGFHLACLVSAFGIALSLFFLLRLDDPRKRTVG